MLASDINDICPFLAVSVLLTSASSASPQSRTFLVFPQSVDLFTSAKWFAVASMATPDSSDSNFPNEPGNEVCDIINCVAMFIMKRVSVPWSQRFSLILSPYERGEHESRSGEKEKPQATLDLNLTFMQTPGSESDPRARIG